MRVFAPFFGDFRSLVHTSVLKDSWIVFSWLNLKSMPLSTSPIFARCPAWARLKISKTVTEIRLVLWSPSLLQFCVACVLYYWPSNDAFGTVFVRVFVARTRPTSLEIVIKTRAQDGQCFGRVRTFPALDTDRC